MHKERKHHVPRQSRIHPSRPPGLTASHPGGLSRLGHSAGPGACELSRRARAFQRRSDLRSDRGASSCIAYRDACHNRAAEDETSELSDLEADALSDLLDCRPTTLAGIAALLEHVADPQWGDVNEDPDLNETVLSGCSNWGGDIKVAALKLPGILAETMRSILERGQS
jgi:hypothetical protein